MPVNNDEEYNKPLSDEDEEDPSSHQTKNPSRYV